MFLKPKEFAMAIGVSYNTLRQHIRREKVFKSGDYIDTENAHNQIYISEQTDGKGIDLANVGKTEKAKTKTKRKATTKNKATTPPKKSTKIKEPEPPPPESENVIDSVTRRKRLADVQKIEKEIELKNLQISKLMGELMPIEMVQKVLVINIQSVFRELESATENIASVYCEILGGDRDHLARMVEEMREALQDSIKNAKEKSKEEIKGIIKDYSATRSRGQRK